MKKYLYLQFFATVGNNLLCIISAIFSNILGEILFIIVLIMFINSDYNFAMYLWLHMLFSCDTFAYVDFTTACFFIWCRKLSGTNKSFVTWCFLFLLFWKQELVKGYQCVSPKLSFFHQLLVNIYHISGMVLGARNKAETYK